MVPSYNVLRFSLFCIKLYLQYIVLNYPFPKLQNSNGYKFPNAYKIPNII